MPVTIAETVELNSCQVLLTAECLAADPAGGVQARLIALRSQAASCQHIAAKLADCWRIEAGDRLAIELIAAEADRSGAANPYHNPAHTRDVTVAWANLAALNNHLHGRGQAPLALDPAALAIGLIAALGHDLLHDGTGNIAPGAQRRDHFRLESVAAARVASLLAQCGLPAARVAIATAAILATDTVAGYAALRWPPRQGGRPPAHPGLAPLSDPTTWLIAAMLRDADLMTSAGLTAAEYDRQTALLSEEQGRAFGTAAAAAQFFNQIARGGFISPAGAVFMPRFQALKALNQVRLKSAKTLSLAETAQRLAGQTDA